MPSASLTSVRVKPVVGLLAVTVTPGTAAPCWSSARPVMLPVVCCATAEAQLSSRIATAPNRCLLIPCLQKYENGHRSYKVSDPISTAECNRNATAYAFLGLVETTVSVRVLVMRAFARNCTKG